MKIIGQKVAAKTTRRRLLVASILSMLTVACLSAIWAYEANGETRIANQDEQTTRQLAELDAKISEITARKVAEKRANAVALAERVTTISTDEAGSIDASLCNQTGKYSDPSSIDVIVNKRHCMQPLNFAPSDLVTVHGATLSRKASADFSRLYEAAAAAGHGFSVTSSYRSFADQVSTYQYWVSTSGVAGADTYSARPGYSEHQTGLVVDIASGGCTLDCFGTTPAYTWMQQHAAEYGFIQRYYTGSEPVTGYKAEEWHYRYVGTEVALDMLKQGIKTLEEYRSVPGGSY